MAMNNIRVKFNPFEGFQNPSAQKNETKFIVIIVALFVPIESLSKKKERLINEVNPNSLVLSFVKSGMFPALTFYYVFKNLALRHALLLNYKAIQEEQAAVTIFIEGSENRRHEPLVATELEKYFGNDVTFDIQFVGSFERHRRKAQYFESHLS